MNRGLFDPELLGRRWGAPTEEALFDEDLVAEAAPAPPAPPSPSTVQARPIPRAAWTSWGG